jgi:glutathione synthase
MTSGAGGARISRRFLFVMDPLERILPDKDTTFVLMLESQHRTHGVYYCTLPDLFANGGVPHARVRRAEVARATPHYRLFEERTARLDWFDVIFMRKDPPVDSAYLFATHLLSLVDHRRSLVLNDPRGLRDANEKLYALNFPDIIPPTIVTSEMPRLRAFLEEVGGQMIVKPLDGCGGLGVFHLQQGDRNLNSILELSTDNGRRLIMGQLYLPAVRRGDKRVIMLAGEPIGATLRVPREDEHRGNIHVGGTCVRTTLSERDLEIAAIVGPRLRADGLVFVGLDIIGDYLTEINVTSPTGVQEINALDGVCLEARVIDHVERCLGSPSATALQAS